MGAKAVSVASLLHLCSKFDSLDLCGVDRVSSQDAIKRRFNGVLPRFTIWSVLFGLGVFLEQRPQGQTSLPGEAGMDIFSTLGKVFKLTGCKRDQKLAIDAGHGLPRSMGRDGIGAW